jgi:hypothetical protein
VLQAQRAQPVLQVNAARLSHNQTHHLQAQFQVIPGSTLKTAQYLSTMTQPGLKLEHQNLVEQPDLQVHKALQDLTEQLAQQVQLVQHLTLRVQRVHKVRKVLPARQVQLGSQLLLKARIKITTHLSLARVQHLEASVTAG